MKKSIITAVMLLMSSACVFAQDTIRWGNPRYMFNDSVQMINRINPLLDPYHYWQSVLMFDYHNLFQYGGWDDDGILHGDGRCISYPASPKAPVTVYGVAIVMDSVDCDTLSNYQFQGTLCQYIGGSLTLVDSALVTNGIDVNRFCASVVRDGVLYEYTRPVYEFYFEQPHVMNDTFYVGSFLPPRILYFEGSSQYRLYEYFDTAQLSIICMDPRGRQLVCSGPDTQLVNANRRFYYFPILQPCAPPEIRFDSVGAWDKVFSWDGDVQDSFQFSVSEYQQPADSGTIYILTDTTITLTDGLRETMLAARVRVKCTSNEAKCPAENRWSPWSEPVYFYFGYEAPDTTHIDTTTIDTTTTGLRLVVGGNIDVTLTPNPASEQVTVAATGMQSVELLAVDGTVIMRREGLMQDEYTLDLKGLAAGVYMVRVSTANGTATRRLMVQ